MGDGEAFAPVKALTFDVFGTVVDWRSSIIREARPRTAGPRLDNL
jgi:hypothetical protein